jgi:hypothetical protein
MNSKNLTLVSQQFRENASLHPAQKKVQLELIQKCKTYGNDEWMKFIWIDEMIIQTAINEGKVFILQEPCEEYFEECLELTFILGFKTVKDLRSSALW